MTQTTACADCGEINPPEARFCIGCGESLALQAAIGPTTKLQGNVCSACGSANPANAQFCATCGRTTGEGSARALPQAVPPTIAPRLPSYPPPQPRIYPRVNVPPVYVPRSTRPAPQWGHPRGGPAIALVAIAFVVLSIVATRSGWPLFVLFLPLGLFGGLFRGRSPVRNWGPVFWMIGLLLLIATKTFWPGILVLWLIWSLIGR